MSIDFSKIKSITTPQGNIAKIQRTSDNITIWKKPETLTITISHTSWYSEQNKQMQTYAANNTLYPYINEIYKKYSKVRYHLINGAGATRSVGSNHAEQTPGIYTTDFVPMAMYRTNTGGQGAMSLGNFYDADSNKIVPIFAMQITTKTGKASLNYTFTKLNDDDYSNISLYNKNGMMWTGILYLPYIESIYDDDYVSSKLYTLYKYYIDFSFEFYN